jgi:serine/threonine-protein kinase
MIEGYNFINRLGRGAFGEVWLAESSATGVRVAVKILHNLEGDALDRFRREVRLLAENLDNRFVVDIVGHDLYATPPHVVMEYCEGGSLRRWVGPPCAPKTAAWALSCAVQGLEGIHRAGGYHRDIKPDNLLLAKGPGGRWIVKVSDFGLARTPDTNSTPMTDSPRGTLAYMAREVLIGGRHTPASDVYSLGVTGMELLTGSRDVRAAAPAATPPALAALLCRMADDDPSARPGLVEISATLQNILSPEVRAAARQASAQQPQATQQPAQQDPQFKIGPGWIIGGGLALLALLAGGDDKQWDSGVGRYRGPDGRFRPD